MDSNITPKISVVMGVYNDTRYLQEAIESILNQTFGDFEFIIIDDGSSDGTREILGEYKNKDSRIKIIHQENIGLTKSLNKGIKLAQGEYIARMDADDISLPERLEKQVEFLDKNLEIAAVGTFAKIIDDEDRVIGEHKPPIEHSAIKKAMFFSGQICHPSAMFRKDVILELGGYDENFKYAQDYDLWFRLASAEQHRNEINLEGRRNEISVEGRRNTGSQNYAENNKIKGYKLANIPEFLFLWRETKQGIGIKNKKEQRKFAQKARRRTIKSGLYPWYYIFFMMWSYLRPLIPARFKKAIRRLFVDSDTNL